MGSVPVKTQGGVGLGAGDKGDAMSLESLRDHSVRNAVLVAALAGLATAVRRDRDRATRAGHPPRIGETALGEPGEVLWYC